MIRRGNHKFIHLPADPDQLFDLESDPHERTNLADDPASAELAGRFRQEIAARWDLPGVDHPTTRAGATSVTTWTWVSWRRWPGSRLPAERRRRAEK
jgi:arylsulfatase A-like enzyme